MSRLRCAIYTRKSTQEGLDQAFNSLEAQREACRAFIASQAGEGWTPLKTIYDDGGFSGGTMDRPALQRLLDDVEANKINVVVVYKVDRLTRSLADFAKIVEAFDARGVSFVSVTQAFNTTTSMGRLTLNVLLSFAQFEREVTGERIRDKIAASKQKGLWMGGVVPLGYDVRDRKLVVNPEEAETVRTLFRFYLEHANTRIVKEAADQLGLRTKKRTRRYGSRQGGEPFQRGHINKLLTNPIYVGEIAHKGVRYPGEHEAIIERSVWDAVQAQLSRNAVARHTRSNANSPSLLSRLLFDSDGGRISPTHANKQGRRYRYYASRSETEGRWRLPAQEIERAVLDGMREFLCDRRRVAEALSDPASGARVLDDLLKRAARLGESLTKAEAAEQRLLLLEFVSRITLSQEGIRMVLRANALRARLGLEASSLNPARKVQANADLALELPVIFRRRGVETKLVLGDGTASSATPDPKLTGLVAQALRWWSELAAGEVASVHDLANRHQVDPGDVSRVLPLAFLAPDIVEAILDGAQPIHLTARRLKRLAELPDSWAKQREMLGFN